MTDSVAGSVKVARWRDLDSTTAYGLLRLRSEVFVVEQDCPYLDPDGRDLEPGVEQLWIEHAAAVVSALRLIPEATGTWEIGRVVTSPDHRGQGLSAVLMLAAIERAGRPIQIRAQAYLETWYSGFGFVVNGPGFLEDGIPHLPMHLE